MGIFDGIEHQLGAELFGGLGGNQQSAGLQAIAGLISNGGGFSALLGKFTQNGLGQQVQSWVGNGQNLPITADHVRQVFAPAEIGQVASQTGIDHSQASRLIANILPHLVDQLTPQGRAVSDGEAEQGRDGEVGNLSFVEHTPTGCASNADRIEESIP